MDTYEQTMDFIKIDIFVVLKRWINFDKQLPLFLLKLSYQLKLIAEGSIIFVLLGYL